MRDGYAPQDSSSDVSDSADDVDLDEPEDGKLGIAEEVPEALNNLLTKSEACTVLNFVRITFASFCQCNQDLWSPSNHTAEVFVSRSPRKVDFLQRERLC